MGRTGYLFPRRRTGLRLRRNDASASGWRRATAIDLPALVSLKTEVVDEAYADLPADALAEWKGRFCSEEYFRVRMTDPFRDTEFYLVGSYSRPVAMAALKIREGKGYLGDLYVAHRGHGLGTALLRDLIDRARVRGVGKVIADVFARNERVVRWLSSEGFQAESTYIEPSLRIPVCRLELEVAEAEEAAAA